MQNITISKSAKAVSKFDIIISKNYCNVDTFSIFCTPHMAQDFLMYALMLSDIDKGEGCCLMATVSPTSIAAAVFPGASGKIATNSCHYWIIYL